MRLDPLLNRLRNPFKERRLFYSLAGGRNEDLMPLVDKFPKIRLLYEIRGKLCRIDIIGGLVSKVQICKSESLSGILCVSNRNPASQGYQGSPQPGAHGPRAKNQVLGLRAIRQLDRGRGNEHNALAFDLA